ncbi:MAG TPA: mannose-1-phosphate guanylyltransferase/mannose-6-phosphate isomerase [Spongiibacteraceae bacterium]|jgi:mannose-1-phosphate guanylyltransferase/mannose-6-phosphate isomerase|nr:mannose-1-phosphate guanylyltransferase/mannose-6-phosphate isomerase [Spongiibacteraceae bacterium]HUH38127.1 mannose-1-phosphate guanylyltransferase/mannose-6-phosphate isomerase [Spongiibacteraceae bacterium]
MLIPVLLCGGVGSRLWPVSRELYPKQFLPLLGADSLLVQTCQRTQCLPDAAPPIIVCNEEHRFLVAEQLRQAEAGDADIVLEPVGRNTAPAVAIAALTALARDPQAILLVLPADHIIQDTDAFAAAVAQGMPAASAGRLVTFGIVPSQPETGYGYIRRGAALAEPGVYAIEQFVEKPDLSTAERYVQSGEYWWNSGMFLLGAQTYIEQLEQFAPAILAAARSALTEASHDLDFVRLDKAAFGASPADSIDYAVMEHTRAGAVVPVDCGWSDVGAWSSLWDVDSKDIQGNACIGDVLLQDVADSYVRSDSRLVAAVGVDNLVIVETADAVLVADKARVQDVKHIVAKLKRAGRNEATVHTRAYRPWGSYESLVTAGRFQVKRIIVNPGQQLSLQMHHHRAEHWIVVSGTAKVTCGEREVLLTEDQSTYIPLGTRHRLSNPGVIPLELIEVQTGSYLGEDDIVRFQDVYGRDTPAQ